MYATFLPSHPPWLFHPNIWWRIQILKLLIMNFLLPPITSSLLDPYVLLSALFSVHIAVYVFTDCPTKRRYPTTSLHGA
jgi:hypothetical protein